MNQNTSKEQKALRAELRQAREELEGLEQNLRAIDGELEALSPERERYRLVNEICVALNQLQEQGAAALFWGDRSGLGEGENHVRQVRARVDTFQRRVCEIESRRLAVVEKLDQQQETSDFLEDDVFEAELREEQRKLEWVLDRPVSDLPSREAVMPWSRGGEDDQRFRKALAAALLLCLLLGLVIPLIDLPLPESWKPVEVPDRFARLIREARPLPPPQPQLVETEQKPEPTEDVATPEPTPVQTPTQSTASKGILAFREKFSELAENDPAARLGAQARIRRAGEAATGRPQRSLVATQAQGTSGGINVAGLSRDVGGGGGESIERVEVARASSSIGAVAGEDRPLSDGPGMSRTDEEIQIVFDRHKAALYRLYNRELRNDPTLKGQMVLRITIEPDGSVSLCKVQSTDMKAATLSAQVVGRVSAFDFGAKDDISAITILYPIDFLPAT